MKKMNHYRAISFILSLVLVVISLPISAAVDSNVTDIEETVREANINDPVVIDPIMAKQELESADIEQLKNLNSDEKTFSELKIMSVDVASLPDFIDSAKALQKGHVNRVRSKEPNLSTVVYQNNDGTETTYIFMRPVKYVDANGDVRDKSRAISSVTDTTYSYAMLENSTKVYFPKAITGGSKIQYKNYSIIMSPKSDVSSAPTYIDENTIVYGNVFGANTLIRYQTRLNGLKEDIVLIKNVDQNEFDFELKLEGLSPILINNIWYLIDSSEDVVASLGDIIISDSAGNSTEGTMTISNSDERDKYNVKITVPSEFLYSETTVYPVYVDPSTYIMEMDMYSYYDEYGVEYYDYYDAIQDTGLYSTSAAATLAQSNQGRHKLGYYSSANGKIIYKLYDFFGEYGKYKTLESSQIGNAFLYITVYSGTAATVTVNPMTSTWSTSAVGENPIAISDSTLWSSYSTAISSSLTLDSTSGERAINITEIVRGWADYNNGESTAAYNNPANGFVLSSNATASYRDIASVEDNDTDIYVVMDTNSRAGSYYITNSYTGGFLRRKYGTSVDISKYTESDDIRWYLEYIGNNKYYIRSMYNKNYALYGSGSSVSLSYMPDTPTDNYVWTVNYATGGGMIFTNVGTEKVLKHNGSSLSLSTALSSGNADYKQTVWAITAQSEYVNLTSFSITNVEWISVGSTVNSVITATPSNSTYSAVGWFDWESSYSDVATVDSNGRITAIGKGYTIIKVTHRPTGKIYKFTVVIDQLVTNGFYQIRNVDSEKYIELEGPSTSDGTYIQQGEFYTNTYAKWNFIYSGLGYYYIKSAYSNKYLSVCNPITSSSLAIIQTSSSSDACKWKISVTNDGNYIFVSKMTEKVISLPYSTDTNGIDLQQITYTNDNSYIDEWVISKSYDVSLIAIPESYDRTSFFERTKSNLALLGYDNNVYAEQTHMNHNFMIEHMEKSKITVIRTHGSQTSIVTSNDSINVNKMSSFPADKLSNSELIIYGACETGKGKVSSTNLVNATFDVGADIVIGFEEQVRSGEVNMWIGAFFDALKDGETVFQSCKNADSYVEKNWLPIYPNLEITTDSWYVAGDSNKTFTDS